MEDIVKTAKLLAEKLSNSDFYKQYLSAKHKLDSNPELKEKVRVYKKLNLEYQDKLAQNNPPPSFDEEKVVSHKYWELAYHEVAGDFILGEKKLKEALNKIYGTIAASCEIEMFLDI